MILKRKNDEEIPQHCKEGRDCVPPDELWQRIIWPQCGPAQGKPWASVSRTWQRLVCSGIEHFCPTTLRYDARLKKSLTKAYLGQFTSLRSFYLNHHTMRLASALPALASLPQLRTLAFASDTPFMQHENLIGKLTQVTALDLDNVFIFGNFFPSPHLKLLRLGSLSRECIEHGSNLTYLDIRSHSIGNATLSSLSNLQALSARFCRFDSYACFTSLTSLVFLNLEFSYCYDSTSVLPLGALTNLTALSLSTPSRVTTETIIGMTQLRVLGIGDANHRAGFSLDSLDDGVMARLSHLDTLFYNGISLGGLVPRAVTQWRHPLPSHYFNTDCSSLSPFMNEQSFI